MHFETDTLIIGGGLAGLTAALHLEKAGLNVILIEKNEYPHHKVCGEYISNEVIPYLNWLGVNVEELRPAKIQNLTLTTRSGKTITGKLPLGGFGISRYTLDHFLYRLLLEKKIAVIQDNVTEVGFTNDFFSVRTTQGDIYKAKHVLGAHGKRSTLDQKLNRKFMSQKSPFLAVKAHYLGHFPNDLVALYNFKGGYCGVSKVEDGKINICYLADYETFKKHKNIEDYQKAVLYENKDLSGIFEQSKIIFDQPISISQLYFGTKTAVHQHILMIGDTAGLIHPLCGNGMAMAIHSAKKASELLIDFSQGKINSRAKLEAKYTSVWNAEFNSRLKMGSLLSFVLQKEKLTAILMKALTFMPFLLNKIITKTHGKPISIPSLK
ncbi:NAD(P)/FAD-dependent oxidoreductase [Pedobacter fastidiosus]|uniref:NAD(P)/FAD-dependent oxidoreductase n=1 Tax=Pedobacter fastidiosus TaxID=2765361 RepID=A0ABR7KUU5_9SPHI|nr:NAD(P)/FAD-dependent oxidoreductase [Pedobacter fastidiosus]MBC6111605.1 NAD(P)/FAD-dependent oxidoreductase [Pedobacter fastidiosus]